MFYTMHHEPGPYRFGGASLGREAGLALDCNSKAWELLQDPDWCNQFRAVLIEELADLTDEEDEAESAVHAQEKRSVEWLLSPDGFSTLRKAARDLSSHASAYKKVYDDQPRGSCERTCVRVLDRFVMELGRIGYEEGTRLVRRRPPQAHCAVCGLTMDCYAADGIPMQPTDPPPHHPNEIEPVGSGLQTIKLQLQRSVVPSAAEPGWALWRRLAPCGHMLHAHCAIKAAASPLTAASPLLCCPAEGCGLACTLASSNWWFGKSVTLSEMDDRYSSLDPARLAMLDPRSTDALDSWLGVASTLGLQEARKLCTARHSAAVEGEEEDEEPWSEHDDEVWEDGSDAMDTRGAHHPPSAGTGSISAPATATAETPLSSDSNDDDVPGLLRDDGSDYERGGGGGKKVKTKL